MDQEQPASTVDATHSGVGDVGPGIPPVHAGSAMADDNGRGRTSPTGARSAHDDRPLLSAPAQDSAHLPLEATLGLLYAAAADVSRRSTPPTAAAVSLALRKLDPTFSPRGLGFRNFRQLLEVAEGRGLVSIDREHRHADLLVHPMPAVDALGVGHAEPDLVPNPRQDPVHRPTRVDPQAHTFREPAGTGQGGHVAPRRGPGQAPTAQDGEPDSASDRLLDTERFETNSTPTAPRVPFVRRDLWQAFVDWNASYVRAWDSAQARVETAEAADAATRQRWFEQHPRYRPITPVTRATQVRWMGEFADGELENGPVRTRVLAALSSSRPLESFTNELRRSGHYASWRQFLHQRVLAEIRSWIQEQGVNIQLDAEPTSGLQQAAATQSWRTASSDVATTGSHGQRWRLQPSPDADEDELRSQVLRAVGRMPVNELLRLPIPLQYLLQQ